MNNIRRKTKKALLCFLGLTLILGHFSGIGVLAATPYIQEAIQPDDDTLELCARQNWVIAGRTSLPSAQSGITLPYRRLTASERAVWIAEYWEMGGPVAFELEVMRLVNEVRIANGRSPVQPDRTLAMAARFHAQTMATFGVEDNWSHHVGPYNDGSGWASRNAARAFGVDLFPWTGGNAGVSWSTGNQLRADSPERQVESWMNSPGHCRLILDHGHRYVGAGTHAGSGWANHVSQSHVSNYLFLSRVSSLPRHTTTVEGGSITTALGETTNGEFLAGETVAISATVPSGHQFVRWEGPPSVTFANATNENTTFVMPASNVTVQAITEADVVATYTITFDANGGVNAPSPQIKTHGVDLILTASEPTRTGYTFLGWATSATATVAEYEPGAVFRRDANTTLFAVWQSTSTSGLNQISRLVIGGFEGIIDQAAETITFRIPNHLLVDGRFSGYINELIADEEMIYFWDWGITPYERERRLGDFIDFASGDLVYNADGYFYEIIIEVVPDYTITFDANGGVNAPSPQIKIHGVDLILTASEPTRTGYTFLGWATSATATVAEYEPGAVFRRDANTTLFAVWQPEITSYTITFNANGGVNAPSPQIKTHGVDLILTSSEPTRTGYTFLGWATSATATVAEYEPGAVFRRDGDTTLFAVWQSTPPAELNQISRLVIGDFEGIIDQAAETITFRIPDHLLVDGRFSGIITELTADEETIYFWDGADERVKQLGDFIDFASGDLVYNADGYIYTIIIEAPDGRLINHLRIGSVTGVINQEAATITFTVPAHLLLPGMFRGPIAQLDAYSDTLVFWVDGAELPATLGQTVGINHGDLVYVAGGRVYTIRIITR